MTDDWEQEPPPRPATVTPIRDDGARSAEAALLQFALAMVWSPQLDVLIDQLKELFRLTEADEESEVLAEMIDTVLVVQENLQALVD